MIRRRAKVARLAVGTNLPEEETRFIPWENFPEPLITTSHFVGPNSARIHPGQGQCFFWPMGLVQSIKPILKYNLAGSLPPHEVPKGEVLSFLSGYS